MQTTIIKTESFYKRNYLHFILHSLLALLIGPFIIFMMVHTAVMNKVEDPVSWSAFGVCSLLFIFLSYAKFKYIYYTYFKEHSAEIDHHKKTILFLPYNQTILIEKVTAFVYLKKLKKYAFRYADNTWDSFEWKRNEIFEDALNKCSLECKEE